MPILQMRKMGLMEGKEFAQFIQLARRDLSTGLSESKSCVPYF